MRPVDRRPALRRRRFDVVLVVGLGLGILACTSKERSYHPSIELEVTPLPPVAGEPLAFTLNVVDVSYVDIYQGDELVWSVVNNDADGVPPTFNRFVARSAVVPRAVGYGANGVRIEALARTSVAPPPPIDAGVDSAPPPPPAPFAESCPDRMELTPDVDAGMTCGQPSALSIPLRARNERATPVDFYRTQQPPNQCVIEGVLRVFPGTTEKVTLFTGNFVRIIDGQTQVVLREMNMTGGRPCDLVIR